MKSAIEKPRGVPIEFADQVFLPPWVVDFPSFHRWTTSDTFPEAGSISYCGDRILVDVTMEKYVHNQIKGKIATALTLLIEEDDLGEYVYDRMRLTHHEGMISTEPDGMFFFHDTRRTGKVTLEEGDDSLEIVGTPDMVLEVVSPTSAKKDTELLMDLYWEAGVAEYWLVDARKETPTLDIYRHGPRRFTLVRKRADWSRSAVFGKAFRLTVRTGKQGNVIHQLESQ